MPLLITCLKLRLSATHLDVMSLKHTKSPALWTGPTRKYLKALKLDLQLKV